MAVEEVKELHTEVGVDPFGEHGDGLGDVEVLALAEELADAKCLGRAEWGAALILLDGGDLPSTNQHVDRSAMIGEFLALAEG